MLTQIPYDPNADWLKPLYAHADILEAIRKARAAKAQEQAKKRLAGHQRAIRSFVYSFDDPDRTHYFSERNLSR